MSNQLGITPTKVVAFSTNGIDTHSGYSKNSNHFESFYPDKYSHLIKLLKNLGLTAAVTGRGAYTVPVSGIYQVAVQANSVGVNNCSVNIHKFKAGDVIPVDSAASVSIYRIQ